MNEQKVNENGSGGIEWTRYKGRPGWTWNPVVGCSHQCQWVMPDGTEIECYAKRQAEGPRMAKLYPNSFAFTYFHPHRLGELKEAQEPSGIFISSMGDLFHKDSSPEYITRVFDAVRQYPQHVFFVLTKDFMRMNAYITRELTLSTEVPRNVLLGVSMPPDRMNGREMDLHAKQKWLGEAIYRLGLLRLKGYTTWMSFEPLSWDVASLLRQWDNGLDWAVIGAASAGMKYFPPNMEHLAALQQLLDERRVPTFYKGNLREFVPAIREDFPRQP